MKQKILNYIMDKISEKSVCLEEIYEVQGCLSYIELNELKEKSFKIIGELKVLYELKTFVKEMEE